MLAVRQTKICRERDERAKEILSLYQKLGSPENEVEVGGAASKQVVRGLKIMEKRKNSVI